MLALYLGAEADINVFISHTRQWPHQMQHNSMRLMVTLSPQMPLSPR